MSSPAKRRRDSDATEVPAAPRPSGSSLAPSSLPPSSPPAPFTDDENEGDGVQTDVADVDDGEEEGDGEDLFGDEMGDDYVANERLDVYDRADLDDEGQYAALDGDARAAAERKMQRRDRRERGERADAGEVRRRNRAPKFLQSDSDEASDGEAALLNRPRRRRMYDEVQDDADDVADEELPLEQLGDIKANSIKDWIETDAVRRAIIREFRDFLMTYVDETSTSVYGQRIKGLGEQNAESLEVSFLHLADSKPIISYFLANCPATMLALFDTVALDVVKLYYPDYDRIHSEIHVRITELPTAFTLRELRHIHLDALVRVSGVVTRRTGVFPQLKEVKFDCGKCGEVLGPFFQDATTEVRISFCSSCQAKGPFTINSEQTVYRNYQRMTLQESPGSVPAGRLPRHREVILLWDLIDSAKPGEEIEVTGVYRHTRDAALNVKNGFPVFSTVLEANHINKRADKFASSRLTEDDERAIRALARDPRIGKRLVKSIAPSIYGHEDIKTALCLALFGGVAKDVNRKHRIRGDINVLMLGDPGTAKSQFLRYIQNTAGRAVSATGQGASAVGLTASVRKDAITHEWTLEGGALVLADKGVCCIDEFDKMNDQDRTSIHEAMEQQSISISKAGIVTTLQARCSVIAAANPIKGRYNSTIPFSQNVELTEPILSRFDVLCVVKDNADPMLDEMLAKFVVGSHTRSHPDFQQDEEAKVGTVLDADIIQADMLRKYIQYARDRCKPKLAQLDVDKLSRLYADLRRESLSTGALPISMIRMSEASAKMRLSEHVQSNDIDLAIQVTVGSFISAQKVSITKQLERGFRKYVHQAQDSEELLVFLLGQLVKERYRLELVRLNGAAPSRVDIKVAELEERAKDLNVHDVQPFLTSSVFRTNGYRANGGVITKAFDDGEL